MAERVRDAHSRVRIFPRLPYSRHALLFVEFLRRAFETLDKMYDFQRTKSQLSIPSLRITEESLCNEALHKCRVLDFSSGGLKQSLPSVVQCSLAIRERCHNVGISPYVVFWRVVSTMYVPLSTTLGNTAISSVGEPFPGPTFLRARLVSARPNPSRQTETGTRDRESGGGPQPSIPSSSFSLPSHSSVRLISHSSARTRVHSLLFIP